MEGNKNIKKIIFSLLAVLLLITAVVGITYAYFGAGGTTSEQTVTSGNLSIGFETGNILRTEDLYPIKDEQINTHATELNFTVTNTGNVSGYFDISLTDIVMDHELQDSNFKWRLLEGETIVNEGNFVGVETSKLLQRSIQIDATNSKTYKLLVWISENNADQNHMQGKSLVAKVSVKSRDRLAKFALSSTPTLADTVNGNEIQNLKMYGNTVDGVSVGTLNETTNKYDINITTSGKNLFNLDKASSTPNYHSSFTVLDNGFRVVGVINDESSLNSYKNGFVNAYSFESYPMGSYTLSYKETCNGEMPNPVQMNLRGFDEAGTRIYSGNERGTYNNTTKRYSISFTLTVDIHKFYGELKVFGMDCNITDIQLETGSTSTSYELYQEPVTYTVSLSAPLRSNGSTKDYIDFESGKVVRLIGADGSILSTPTEETITLPTIKTLNGTTIISTNSIVQPTIQGSY